MGDVWDDGQYYYYMAFGTGTVWRLTENGWQIFKNAGAQGIAASSRSPLGTVNNPQIILEGVIPT